MSLPVDLVTELAFDESDLDASCGFELRAVPPAREGVLPEIEDLGALATSGGPTAEDGAGAQVDAKWARSGVRAEGGTAVATELDPNVATVEDFLRRDEGLLPEGLRPFLGDPGPHPRTSDGLPPGYRLPRRATRQPRRRASSPRIASHSDSVL